MWWWNCRGYTPAGVEAWNCIRALDYLETRKEVDAKRIGVTGRSGGGAYSWWIAAIDERIKVAVPVAGITDLQNHVVDGCVEGHCDCMFMVNTYRWDYPLVAALVAPRPLLISNTDKDTIFPLDGVSARAREGPADLSAVRRREEPRPAHHRRAAQGHAGTAGPRLPLVQPVPERREPADPRAGACRSSSRSNCGSSTKLPADQINTKIQETFVPAASAPAACRNRPRSGQPCGTAG